MQLFSAEAILFSKRKLVFLTDCPNSPETEILYHEKHLNAGLGI